MRSDAAQYDLLLPRTLHDALTMLASEPGKYTPFAGGTELMVALNTGRLQARSLVSIRHLAELRFLRTRSDGVDIGAGTTFTDIRRNADIAAQWPLLALAASWTGSVANQNRGTLGGNLCNASPAADTPPALLAYEASVTLVSAAGTRTLPYREFHLGYKRTALHPDELLHTIHVPAPPRGSRQYIRKVGTRNAQAISKVALAAVCQMAESSLTQIRIAAASLADRPTRFMQTEAVLQGRSLRPKDREATIRMARAAFAQEAEPIDDIRSTARYRSAVGANLLEEALRSLL